MYLKKNYGGRASVTFFTESNSNSLPTVNTYKGIYTDITSVSEFDDISFTENSYPVFHIPSWATSKTKKDIGWITATSNFIKKRKGIFVPA